MNTKKKIKNFFKKQDIRALVSKESLINNTAAATFREYNTEQMVIVESPNNQHKVLITKYGEVADGEYLDPKGNQVISYDHIKQVRTEFLFLIIIFLNFFFFNLGCYWS